MPEKRVYLPTYHLICNSQAFAYHTHTHTHARTQQPALQAITCFNGICCMYFMHTCPTAMSPLSSSYNVLLLRLLLLFAVTRLHFATANCCSCYSCCLSQSWQLFCHWHCNVILFLISSTCCCCYFCCSCYCSGYLYDAIFLRMLW